MTNYVFIIKHLGPGRQCSRPPYIHMHVYTVALLSRKLCCLVGPPTLAHDAIVAFPPFQFIGQMTASISLEY